MSYRVEDFRLDLRGCVSPAHHIWASSGWSTCSPLAETAAGVLGCFSPPFAARDARLTFALRADGHLIRDEGSKGKEDCGLLFSGSEWFPGKIVRKGTYHYDVEGNLLSLGTVSELVPLTGRAGFLLRLSVTNRRDRAVELDIVPTFEPGAASVVPLSEWGFMPPGPQGEAGERTGEGAWETAGVRATLLQDHAGPVRLEGFRTHSAAFAVVFTRAGTPVEAGGEKELPLPARLDGWRRETQAAWEAKIARANESLPTLESDIPGLEAYYRRSLVSGLVCLWENDTFVTQPFPATSGVDGGSLCCYPWDAAGYAARTLVMLLGGKALEFVRHMLRSGIDRHICMAPDGTGLGWCSYSYSMWSIVNLYRTVLAFCGEGFELFDEVVAIFLNEEERLPERDGLKDYGRQHNLLEMRTCGYEYVVASPNAERAWCYDTLADIARMMGRGGSEDWHGKAERIREAIRERLWDADRGWFRALHPDGHVEWVYTIQAFDALRLGACTRGMADALVSHVREGAFLGRFGVSSVSAEDEVHYELNDPDWSGGGSYSGDGPELAETLWDAGYASLAEDVLRRHFWMGGMLPYFPQEHLCDKPGVPANKRANIIAGVAGVHAVLFGMFGIKPGLDGSLRVAPHPPSAGRAAVRGFVCRGRRLDVTMEPGWVEVRADGKQVYAGEPREVQIP